MKVDSLNNVVHDIFQLVSSSTTKRYKPSTPLEEEDKDSDFEIESKDDSYTTNNWPHFTTTLYIYSLERYLYEYLEQDLENAYLSIPNKTESKICTKKNKMTKIYNTLKMCKPSNIEMVTETKPHESNVLLKWKIDFMDVSNFL